MRNKVAVVGAIIVAALAAVSLTQVPGKTVLKKDGHACTTSDYFAQCAGAPNSKQTRPPLKGVVARGVDFAWGGPSVSTMKANGWSFGASYLSFDSSKNFSPALINAYHANGIASVLVWETGSTRATQGWGAGRSDAFNAVAQANARGAWHALYFAIDCDCSTGQVASYFDGVRSVLPVSKIGAYGGYYPIRGLFNEGKIHYGWQTYAWSGGLWDGRAQLEQYLNDNSVDYDRAISSDYGQTPFGPPPPPPDPYHYRALSTRTQIYHSKAGLLRMNERDVTLQYDYNRSRHSFAYPRLRRLQYLERVLANRVAYVAIHDRRNWGFANRGVRFSVLIPRAQGKRVATW